MGDNSDRSAIFQVQIGNVVPTILGITHEWEITLTGQLYFRFQIGYVVPTIIGITHKWEITLDRQAIFQVPIGNVLPTSQD